MSRASSCVMAARSAAVWGADIVSRTRRKAVRIRVFTVPSGVAVRAAISTCVSPSK